MIRHNRFILGVFFLLWLIQAKGIKAQSYTISTIAGNGKQGFSGDRGAAILAELYNPSGIALDGLGNIYISDSFNQRIRKINTKGIISTIAGNGTPGNAGIGGIDTLAELYYPYALTIDKYGNLYIADWSNNVINKINTAGIISIFAGTGAGAYSGDRGLAKDADINLPSGIAFDQLGNAYIADDNNNRVRMVNTGGIISTFAGNGYGAGHGYPGSGGYFGDGGIDTDAEFHWPSEVTVDKAGNVYIADQVNGCIRMIDTNHIISTIAGNGISGFSGDGGAATSAELNNPSGIIVDGVGNIYIGDINNNRIRRVDKNGQISTIAGNGTKGYYGDGGIATSAELNSPSRMAIDDSDNIYVCDGGNNVIRKLKPMISEGINTLSNKSKDILVYPNPNNGKFSFKLSGIDAACSIEIYNIIGERLFVASAPFSNLVNTVNLSNQPNGLYLYKVIDGKGNAVSNGKFVIQK